MLFTANAGNCREWTSPLVSLLAGLGNRRGATVWEARLPPGRQRPNGAAASRAEREAFITAKYKERAFLAAAAGSAVAVNTATVESGAPTTINSMPLADALAAGDLVAAAAALASAMVGAMDKPAAPTVDGAGAGANMHARRLPVHCAVMGGSPACLELVLLNSADPARAAAFADGLGGRTPVMLARACVMHTARGCTPYLLVLAGSLQVYFRLAKQNSSTTLSSYHPEVIGSLL